MALRLRFVRAPLFPLNSAMAVASSAFTAGSVEGVLTHASMEDHPLE
jgi:hypothetical protein